MKHLRTYSKINWSALVRYNEESYSGLSDCNGKPVGIVSSKGRWVFRYEKSYWDISRIILCLVGRMANDSLVVDHLDGDSLNNKVNNLRLVTQSVNSLNKKKQSNNSSGVTGVSFHTRDRYYSAYTEYDGVPRLERFYIKDYGDNAKEEAIKARLRYEQSNELMTERHGK